MPDRHVAVIITAANAAATAAKAVRSALAQEAVAEVVFVDDGSQDDTADVAAAAGDASGRLRIIRLSQNRGPSHGRNVAIDASSAPLICILDADDFMAPTRIADLLAEAGEDWDMLGDDMHFATGPDEALVYDRLFLPDVALPATLDLEAFCAGNMPSGRYRREYGFLKPLIRRAFLDAHGLRYDERLRLGEDLLLYADCLVHGARFRIVRAHGYYAVELPTSLSANHRTADLAASYAALLELAERARRAGAPTRGLSGYIRSFERRLATREALDAKREGGMLGLVRAIGTRPRHAPSVLRELGLGKLQTLLR